MREDYLRLGSETFLIRNLNVRYQLPWINDARVAHRVLRRQD